MARVAGDLLVGRGFNASESLPEAGGAEAGDGGGGGMAGAAGEAVTLGSGLAAHWRIDGGRLGRCISGKQRVTERATDSVSE